MAGKLKKEVKKAISQISNVKARTAAEDALKNALKNNKPGSSAPAISPKELEKIKQAALKYGSGPNVKNLVTKIIHPQNRPIGQNQEEAPGPPPTSYYYDDDFYYPGPPPPVRVPDRDVVNLATESIDAETIINLLFENIGANELTKFVRHDTVEGINPYYDIISNLSDIKRRFDPASLISLQKSNLSNFDIFPIKLQDKIPDEKYLEDNNLSEYVFFGDNGDLIIEVVNMADSEIVEIQIDTSGTIYEIEELYDN